LNLCSIPTRRSSDLALCGYSSNLRRAFIWLFSDFKSKDFFSGNKRYSDAGAVINFFNRSKDAGQLEAICFTGPAQGFTSSEIIKDRKSTRLNSSHVK